MRSSITIELEEGWGEISEKGVKRIINYLEIGDETPFDKKEYSHLYTLVYNMCTQRHDKNYSGVLYGRYKQTLSDYLLQYKIESLRNSTTAFDFLTLISQSWDHYQSMKKWLKNFFQYLDRHHVTQNDIKSLLDVAYEVFQKIIIEEFKEKIIVHFLEILRKDREGEAVETDVLHNVHLMISILDNLEKTDSKKLNAIIENNVLQHTYEFYAKKSMTWIDQDSLSDYLKKAEENLQEENRRCVKIMGEDSWNKIEAKYLEIVIKDKILSLLEKETGMLYLLKHDKRHDLAILHKLTASSRECQTHIASTLVKFIKSEGDVVISEKLRKNEASKTDSPEDPEFVMNLMNLQLRFKSLLAESFKNDSTYQRALNSGFEEIVNKRIGKHPFAEILACYADKILKRTNNRMSVAEVEAQLRKIIDLFDHLEDKQLFAEIFKNQLARRLLNDLSANEDAEKCIISMMKLVCGSQFTAKMEGMNNDLHLAEEILTKYKAIPNNLPIDFTVQVLTNSYWPVFKNNEVSLPKEMKSAMENFKVFYNKLTQHRKLNWVISLGTMEVSRQFENGKYDFVCSPYQGLTLMLFNDKPEFSFREIMQVMKFDEDFCKKILNIFCAPKLKLLEKINGDGKKVNEEDSFRVNLGFSNQVKKIKLSVPSHEENYEKEKMAEDRNHAIDASIVRIMKTRKNLHHNSLIQEVVASLQAFRPQIKDIKQRIENLISREFLERDKSDHNKYNYLA